MAAVASEMVGVHVDSEEQEFRVGEAKLKKLKEALGGIPTSSEVSARQLAALAGQLVSISPAVLPASLFSRSLFLTMQNKVAETKFSLTQGR